MEMILIDAIFSHLNISYLVINTAGREWAFHVDKPAERELLVCNFHSLRSNLAWSSLEGV